MWRQRCSNRRRSILREHSHSISGHGARAARVARTTVILGRAHVSHAVAAIVAAKRAGVAKSVIVAVAATTTTGTHQVRLLAKAISSEAVHGLVVVWWDRLVNETLIARDRPACRRRSIMDWHGGRHERGLVAWLVAIVQNSPRPVVASGRYGFTNFRAAVVRGRSLPGVVSGKLGLGETSQRRVCRRLRSNRFNQRGTARAVRIRRQYGRCTTTSLLTTGLCEFIVEVSNVVLGLGQLQFQSEDLLVSGSVIIRRCAGRSSCWGGTSESVGGRRDWQGTAGGRVVGFGALFLARLIMALAQLRQQLVHGIGPVVVGLRHIVRCFCAVGAGRDLPWQSPG